MVRATPATACGPAASTSRATIRTTPTSVNSSALSGRLGLSISCSAGAHASGGVRYYILDNEHSIWHSTHRDVHPTGVTMDEVRDRMIDYVERDQGSRSGALVVGPEEWGWSGYLFSGYDQQYGIAARLELSARSRRARRHGLPAVAAAGAHASNPRSTGRRVIDIFTVHYYPQGGEFWPGDVSSTRCSSAATARRARCGIRPTWTRPGSTIACS